MNDKPWHKLSGSEMGAEVSRLIEGYRNDQAGRRTRYIRNLEFYEGRRLGGYYGFGYNVTTKEQFEHDRLRLVRSAVSTAVANIYAPQKPKPQFQTLGATWATRRKAYKLDRICEGVLNQRQGDFINVWAFMADAGAEAALQGVAAVKVTADRTMRRIEHDLVPTPDIYADPAEGRRPKNLFQREPIPESVALEKWGKKHRAAIMGAPDYDWYQGHTGISRHRAQRMVELQYAWRLPFGPDKPGKWCAVVGGAVVEEGDWTAPHFPFVFLYWEKHRDGIWGSGIADEASDIAESVSDLDERLGVRVRIATGKNIYYNEGACNPDDLCTNDAVTAVKVNSGHPLPQESLTPPFSPVEAQFKQDEIREFWDAIGISQLSAAARREKGVDSGTAQMVLNDTKAGRQLVKSQRYEQAYVDLAHQYVWRLRELAEEDPDFAVKYPGESLLRDVKWKTADPENDDMFSVTVAPASNLPHDPAGRQQMVQNLFQTGIISPETAKSLMGWPDLESELNVENSELEYVDSLIEVYQDADPEDWDASDYQPPEGFIFNKPQALRRFASAWFRSRIDQRSLSKEEQRKAEYNIKLLQRYIRELEGLINQDAAKMQELQQMQAGQAQPGQAGAAPMPAQQMPPVAA